MRRLDLYWMKNKDWWKFENGSIVINVNCAGATKIEMPTALVYIDGQVQGTDEVTNFIKAGGACGACKDDIQGILDKLNSVAKPMVEIKPVARMTNVQRMQKVMTILSQDIAPRLALDGGSIELIDVDGTTVVVALRGACSGCHASQLTLKNLVEKTLREQVDPAINVVEA